MNFSTFFSQQARKPSGLFGKWVMSFIFNIGNADLNQFVKESMAVQEDDHILEIGCGTGKLVYEMAGKIDTEAIEGIVFSDEMLSEARWKNRKYIADGTVKLTEGNFDEVPYKKETFTKICSVNTICFWPDPAETAGKAAEILKPGGMFAVGFEDINCLKQKSLSHDVFSLYSKSEVEEFLTEAGFSGGVNIETRTVKSMVMHCAAAEK